MSHIFALPVARPPKKTPPVIPLLFRRKADYTIAKDIIYSAHEYGANERRVTLRVGRQPSYCYQASQGCFETTDEHYSTGQFENRSQGADRPVRIVSKANSKC